MSSLRDIYGSVDFSSLQKSKILKSSLTSDHASFESVSESRVNKVVEHDFGIQQKIRKLFGKSGIRRDAIGGHPDFDYLVKQKAGETKNGFTVSLFMDIKGSTKLGVIYPPEDVFFIKNKIIKCAIETILAFDGHVHRIMGDAVLAFFRSDGLSTHNAAIDAINCGAYLVQLMKDVVMPELNEHDLKEDVGIRIGVDYGSDKDVLWGMYGYSGASEVTATSFYVDVAAKLQQASPRNRVMLGQSIKELLDLHEDIVEKKFRVYKGEKIEDQFVTPNYIDASGEKINYRQFVLNQKNYFALLPKPSEQNKQLLLTSTLKEKSGVPSSESYFACSRVIPKAHGVEFKVRFQLADTNAALRVRFRVENHGNQALNHAGESRGNHDTFVDANLNVDGEYFAKHWEGTSYLGMHYMYVSVWDADKIVIPEECYGIYVGDSTS